LEAVKIFEEGSLLLLGFELFGSDGGARREKGGLAGELG
jgi:hypothetical protein